ncbi:MAG: hypothetical protein ACRDL5_08445 [Solirubrobacteraceae bacterium]
MDPFAIVVLVGLTALVLWVWMRGRSGRGQAGGPSATSARACDPTHGLEDEDLEQLLSATNARRRARGLPERSAADAEAELGQDPLPRG